jgi:hypothetical protein
VVSIDTKDLFSYAHRTSATRVGAVKNTTSTGNLAANSTFDLKIVRASN